MLLGVRPGGPGCRDRRLRVVQARPTVDRRGYLRITDDQYLELFPDGVGDRAPGRDTTGMNHLCLGVADIDQAIEDLTAANVPLAIPKKMAADKNWQCWVEGS